MKKQSLKQPLKETLMKIGGKHLLKEYNDDVATYSNELGAYIKILKPKIKGWSFDVERLSGAWEWYHPKFEDSVLSLKCWPFKILEFCGRLNCTINKLSLLVEMFEHH